MKLVVNTPFGDYKQGDEITDPAAIHTILISEQSAYVVPAAHEMPVAADPPLKSK